VPAPHRALRGAGPSRTIRALRRGSIALALVTVAAILLLTLSPLGTGTDGRCAFGMPCALGHLGSFAVLGVAIGGWYATSEAARRSPVRVLLMTLLALWLFAALDEIAQPRVGRDANFEDWALDMAGAVIGMFAGSAALRAVLGVRAAGRDRG
jgi:hypothetical protein